MKIAIYTSLAINYLAKARVLAQTVKDANPAIDVFAMVCDRFPSNIDPSKEPFDDIWMVEEYPAKPLKGWIYRHNIMELATAVKGWGLKRLLDLGYDYVLYLDPDCWVMEDPAQIIELLPPDCSVGVVPHTLREADTDEEIRIIETSSLRHGIYNLGFLIVRNDANGMRLAKWWAARLDQYCVDDFKSGLFTDQRWFDLAVGYFDFIRVIRHKGIDVASWNIGQRQIERSGGGYTVDGDPLIFYHFSGVGPTGVHRWVRDKFAPSDALAAEIEFRYEKLIDAVGQQKLQNIVPYYECYTNGRRIEKSHRQIYRENPEIAEAFPDPYCATKLPELLAQFARSDAAGSGNSKLKNEDKMTAASFVTVQSDQVDQIARRLFDFEFYKLASGTSEVNPDQIWKEYLRCPRDRQRSFNRYFDSDYYRFMLAGRRPVDSPTLLHHYVAHGLALGVSPSWIFDEAYYLERYPDIADAVRAGDLISGFEHFSKYGAEEGRNGCAFFNERRYRELNADVASAIAQGEFRSGEEHYVKFGRKEGRPFR